MRLSCRAPVVSPVPGPLRLLVGAVLNSLQAWRTGGANMRGLLQALLRANAQQPHECLRRVPARLEQRAAQTADHMTAWASGD